MYGARIAAIHRSATGCGVGCLAAAGNAWPADAVEVQSRCYCLAASVALQSHRRDVPRHGQRATAQPSPGLTPSPSR